MLEEKYSNFENENKENNKKYRVKRKLGDRNNSFYDENKDFEIKKVKTKFKIAKDQYIDNYEFVFTKKVQDQNLLLKENIKVNHNLPFESKNINCSQFINNFKDESICGINMDMEKNLVEKHNQVKNTYLNTMMFN